MKKKKKIPRATVSRDDWQAAELLKRHEGHYDLKMLPGLKVWTDTALGKRLLCYRRL